MRYMGKWIAGAAIVFIASGSLFGGGVSSTNIRKPDSIGLDGDLSIIGAWASEQGPGAICSMTAYSECRAWKGHIARTSAGSHEYRLVHNEVGHSHTAVLSTNIVGFSWSGAKSIESWPWSYGNMRSANTIAYDSEMMKDGIFDILPDGDGKWITQAAADPASQDAEQKDEFFKNFTTLVSFNTSASLRTGVSSTSTISASPASRGWANGQIGAYVVGFDF